MPACNDMRKLFWLLSVGGRVGTSNATTPQKVATPFLVISPTTARFYQPTLEGALVGLCVSYPRYYLDHEQRIGWGRNILIAKDFVRLRGHLRSPRALDPGRPQKYYQVTPIRESPITPVGLSVD